MKKKRHHHVPQLYLKRWSVDGKLFALRGNEIIHTSPLNLANKRYFYEVEHIVAEDLYPLSILIAEIVDPELREEMREFVQSYWDISQMSDGIKGREHELPELAAYIEIEKKNHIEDTHEIYEGILQSFFDLLDHDNPLIYSESGELWKSFIQVILMQYFRTKRQKINVEDFAGANDALWFKKTWQLRNHILAMQVGMDFFKRKDEFRFVVVHNHTIMPFITGDQPVVNVNATRDLNRHAKGFEIYYPVSPTKAVMLISKQHTEDDIWHVTEVGRIRRLNQMMADHALEEIYADRPEVLELYRPFVGHRLIPVPTSLFEDTADQPKLI